MLLATLCNSSPLLVSLPNLSFFCFNATRVGCTLYLLCFIWFYTSEKFPEPLIQTARTDNKCVTSNT